MANDGWASDYLRQLNTQGPGNPGNVVSSKVQYVPPVSRGGRGSDWVDTSDIPLAPGQNPEDSVYSNASGASMGQLKSRSGYNPPAGGGWDVNSSDTNLRFPNEPGARRYARSKTKASAKPAWKRTQKPAVPSGDDVTSTVVQAVRADGNTSFANWRQSLKNEGWTEEQAKAIVYDPSSGKFINTAKSPSSGGALTPDEQAMAERAASHRAETPAAETPAPASGAQPAPAKTEGGAQPAPVSGVQPAPVSGAQPAPVSGAQSDAEIEQLRAQMRAEVNKLRGYGDFGNNVIALAQQWGDKILSKSGKSDAEQMQEMIKQLQWWDSVAPGIVKMNGGN